MNEQKISKAQIAANIIIGASIILWIILFASVNTEWLRVNLPALPWSPKHIATAFETRGWALMLAFAILGSLLTLVLSLPRLRHFKHEKRALQMRGATLERELDRVNKLLVISRDKG